MRTYGVRQLGEGVVVTGVEIAVGYLFAWLVRKAGRVGRRADAEVDRGLDAGMDRLHELVSARLGADPALERARQEAEAGRPEPSERTRRRLTDALDDAAEHDEDFARALARAVEELRAAGPIDTATRTGTASASDGGHANTGVRRPGGAAGGGGTSSGTGSGTATARDTGNATADGPGSEANSGIDYR
ncbi:hypothetical protein AB0399_21360 [Streptomyces sp. NPDC088194]|uniref:hypothetical protein n=1 Tax=Streptomyces sp. NPDC088194 TaxID=3154931 RepID=UPI00344E0598